MATRQYTIGILCPLWVELAAVIATFDEKFEDELDKEHNIYYYPGKIGNRYAVAVCLPDGSMGLDDAGFYAAKLQDRYQSLALKSSLRFLVGIAGGNPDKGHDIRLGDVVIGKKVVNYDKGKKEDGGVLKATDVPYEAPAVLLNGLNKFMLNNTDHGRLLMEKRDSMVDNYRKMKDTNMMRQWTYPGSNRDLLFDADYNHKAPDVLSCDKCDKTKVIPRDERDDDLPVIHTGLIASSNSVLKDGYTRKHLEDYFTEILAVEMEASALKRYKYIVIRGICDYADSHKNDCWQPYAAATAAACCAMLIEVLAPNVEAPEIQIPKATTSELQSASPQNTPTTFSGENAAEEPTTNSRPPEPNHLEQPDVAHSGQNSACAPDLNQVRITWSDMEKKGKDLHEEWKDARVELVDNSVNHYFEISRSLVITNNSPVNPKSISLWMPPANVKVIVEENVMKLQYADCNGLGYKTAYQTQNGTMEYKAKYNPSNPNVKLKIEFPDHDTAEKMANNILYINRSIPGHGLIKGFSTFQSDTMMLFNVRAEDTSCSNMLAMMKLVAAEYNECDLSYLGDYFDYKLSTQDDHTKLFLGLLKKPSYQSKKQISSSWPPEEVRKNVSGMPEAILRDHITSNITFSMDHSDFTAFTNTIVTGWELKQPEFKVGIWWPPEVRKGSLIEAQSTIWSNDSTCHILTRMGKTDQMSVRWNGIVLETSIKGINEDTDQPLLEISDSQLTITFQNVKSYKGDLVSRTSVLPSTADTQDQQDTVENLSHDFKFQNIDELNRFTNTIQPYVNITSTQARDSSHPSSGLTRRLSRILSLSNDNTTN